MKSFFTFVFVFISVLSSTISIPSFAAFDVSMVNFSPVEKSTREGNNNDVILKVTSSGQAAQMVRARFGGKVLKVQSAKVGSHAGYKVKLMKDDGNIVSISVDAVTGQLIGK